VNELKNKLEARATGTVTVHIKDVDVDRVYERRLKVSMPAS